MCDAGVAPDQFLRSMLRICWPAERERSLGAEILVPVVTVVRPPPRERSAMNASSSIEDTGAL